MSRLMCCRVPGQGSGFEARLQWFFTIMSHVFSPSLTWRDVQYLLAYTSNRNRLVDGEWVTNAGGLRVSHKFGFGAIDAEAIVTRGRHWITVPPQMSQVTVVNGGRET